MFEELSRYKKRGHFFFRPGDQLSDVCNAPANQSGIYVVYALKLSHIDLVYMGYTDPLSSLKEEIISGRQFGNTLTSNSWAVIMKSEKIDALDVYWYVTQDDKNNDEPKTVGNALLVKHAGLYERLPDWNNGD